MRLYLSNNIFNWKSWPKIDSIVHVYTDNHYIKHKTKLSLLSLSLSLSLWKLHICIVHQGNKKALIEMHSAYLLYVCTDKSLIQYVHM